MSNVQVQIASIVHMQNLHSSDSEVQTQALVHIALLCNHRVVWYIILTIATFFQ